MTNDPNPNPPEPLKPMNMWEAIEAMKIVAPHASALATIDESISLMRALIAEVSKESPIQVLRLAALLHHKPVETMAEELKGQPGASLVMILAEGLGVNPLPELVNGAYILGLSDVRWPDGR
jgi:hypothetical protein